MAGRKELREMAIASGRIDIPIAGMTCDHCVATVRRALESVPGVRSAAVDLKAGRAEVTLGAGQADRAQLKAAVESVGYSVPENGDGPAPPRLVGIGSL